MPTILRNEKFGSCDLENGMDMYINGERFGYTLGETKLEGQSTWADLFQGQPSKKVGSRLAKIEGVITVPCVELTPEIHALASGIGSLVKTTETNAGVNGEDWAPLHGTQTFWLTNPQVASNSIVVKSGDDATTYTLTTDYTVETDSETGLTGIKRVAAGSIADNAVVHVTYTYTQTINTPYLFYGAAKSPIQMQNIVFAKKNPGATDKPWHIIQVWLVESRSSYSMTWNQDSQSWMTLNLELSILSDELNTQAHHDLCPLWMETWADEFDVHDLPPVPTNYNPVM